MQPSMNRLSILVLCASSAYTTAALSAEASKETVKIACVGDSITFGAGVKNRGVMNYPSQLERMLKEDGKLPNYEVKNFGVSARTMLYKGDHPYSKEKAYKNSIAYQPNISSSLAPMTPSHTTGNFPPNTPKTPNLWSSPIKL